MFAGILRLRIDVGHELVFQFVNLTELVHEVRAVEPRFLRRDAVAAAVRTQHAKRQPAREQILVHAFNGCRREAADVVTPK